MARSLKRLMLWLEGTYSLLSAMSDDLVRKGMYIEGELKDIRKLVIAMQYLYNMFDSLALLIKLFGDD